MSNWPYYDTHKRVQAVKIVSHRVLESHEGRPTRVVLLVDNDGRLEVFEPSVEAMSFKAKAGDYALIYRDGFRSICPAAEFEDCATPVTA